MTPVAGARLAVLRRQLADAVHAGEWGPALSRASDMLALDPTDAEALFQAGSALRALGQEGIATPILNTACQLEPERHEAWNNLGCCLRDFHPADAYAAFRRAHGLDERSPGYLANMCSIASSLGRDEEALAWAERSLALDPEHEDALYNSALALFSLGRWGEAWPRYRGCLGRIKWRQARNYSNERETPRWSPDAPRDARVVVYGEQGIGDEIMFASMFGKLADRDLILECDPRLKGLYERSFPTATVYGTKTSARCTWPMHDEPDYKIEVGGIGEWLAPEPFRRGAYLTADPAKRAMMRAWLDKVSGPDDLRVGIAWTGGTWDNDRAQRSLTTEQLEPILSAPGCTFVCLEYEPPERLPYGVKDLASAVRKGADYDDTAALVAELHLVIAPTTSVVDLAGALGKPCWALVNKVPQWRYAPAAGESAMWWYESVRVYRQRERGMWGAPVAAVAKDLRAVIESKGRCSPTQKLIGDGRGGFLRMCLDEEQAAWCERRRSATDAATRSSRPAGGG